MLWNVVYEFFVVYIFGGQFYSNMSGQLITSNGVFNYLNGGNQYTSGVRVDVLGISMPIGNYFSLIATIITMVAILLFCVFIVKKIIGIIFRLFTGSSAF